MALSALGTVVEERIAAAKAKGTLLQDAYSSIDSRQGMMAVALEGIRDPQTRATVEAALIANNGYDPGAVTAADYQAYRDNIQDIRNAPAGTFIGGSATNPPGAFEQQQQAGQLDTSPGSAFNVALGNLLAPQPGAFEQQNQAGQLDTSPGSDFNTALAQLMEQTGTGTPVPDGDGQQYGLSGAESAINTGLMASLAALDTGVTQGAGALQAAQGAYSPYQSGGAGASAMMADLSGVNGPDAQAAARVNYTNDPGYAFALEEAERALTRNAAATGGLGGGNLRKELVRNAVGFAQQDYNNYFNRLSGQAGQGLQANQGSGALAQALSGLYGGSAGTAANAFTGAGNNIGNLRYNTGVNFANQIQGAAGNLGAMTNQQGSNLTNIIGQGGTNIAGNAVNAGLTNANQLNQLATLLANISQGQGSAQANINNLTGQSQAAAHVDSAAGLRSGISDLVGLGATAMGSLPALPGSQATAGFNPYASQETYNWTTGNF